MKLVTNVDKPKREGKRRQVHKCSVCKKEFFWGKDSTWYGSIRDEDDKHSADLIKACNLQCKPHLKNIYDAAS